MAVQRLLDPHLASVPSTSPETAQEQSRRYGIREGAFQAAMQGGGENYLSAFGLFLHATALQIGLLSALPQLVGTWSQLLSAKLLGHVHHRKLIMVWGAGAQALTWLPLIILPLLFPEHGAWLLIACTVLYVATGHFTVPAWNSLVIGLLSPDTRGSYFARRARVMTIMNFCALASAALLLHTAEAWSSPWEGFVLIFLAAAGARTLSTYYLSQMNEAPTLGTQEARFRLFDFLQHKGGTNFRWFLMFSGFMHLCVLISGPFFVVYMLRDLHLTYWQYGTWMAAGILGQFLSFYTWGRFSDRFGNKRLLLVTGWLVPFLPMQYLWSTDMFFLLALNFLGGVVWSGLSLGLQNYVFDIVREEDRAKGIAVWNSVNAVGWFIGAMIGSWLATAIPRHLEFGLLDIQVASSLPFVFFISGVLRLVVSFSLLNTFHETREVCPLPYRGLLAELPLLEPMVRAMGFRIGPKRSS